MEMGCEGPVFLGIECLNVTFPVADHLDGDRLNPAGAQTSFHLFPEKRRYLITHQTVQYPSGLLRIELVPVKCLR